MGFFGCFQPKISCPLSLVASLVLKQSDVAVIDAKKSIVFNSGFFVVFQPKTPHSPPPRLSKQETIPFYLRAEVNGIKLTPLKGGEVQNVYVKG